MRRALCSECGAAIRTDATSGNYEWVTGAVPLRSAGGANRVALIRRSARFACRGCVDALSLGLIPGQTSMFPTTKETNK